MASASSPTRCCPRESSRCDARCSRSGTRTSPSSPSVHVTSVTWVPRATYFAMVAPWLMLSSSGCACTSNIRCSMRASLVVGEVALDPARGVRQLERRGYGGRGGRVVVQPPVVCLHEYLEHELRGVRGDRPGVVLVVVLAREPVTRDRRLEPVLP